MFIVRPREQKKEVIQAAQSQYVRRGSPAQVTGWGPDEIHLYMRWQFSQLKKGKVKKNKLGGWGWLLPKKAESGEPAPLPDEVIQFNEAKVGDQKKRKEVSESGSSKSSPSVYESSSDQGSDDDDGKPPYRIEPRLVFNCTTFSIQVKDCFQLFCFCFR